MQFSMIWPCSGLFGLYGFGNEKKMASHEFQFIFEAILPLKQFLLKFDKADQCVEIFFFSYHIIRIKYLSQFKKSHQVVALLFQSFLVF